jgi:hypothetical protein
LGNFLLCNFQQELFHFRELIRIIKFSEKINKNKLTYLEIK